MLRSVNCFQHTSEPRPNELTVSKLVANCSFTKKFSKRARYFCVHVFLVIIVPLLAWQASKFNKFVFCVCPHPVFNFYNYRCNFSLVHQGGPKKNGRWNGNESPDLCVLREPLPILFNSLSFILKTIMAAKRNWNFLFFHTMYLSWIMQLRYWGKWNCIS